MSKRYWIALAAVGLAAFTPAPSAGNLDTEPEPARQEQREGAAEQGSIESGLPTSLQTPVESGADEAQPNEERPANEDSREPGPPSPWWLLHDTTAQALMAFATVLATIASIGAVILLLMTLHETRRIGRAQTRAYLSIRDMKAVEGDAGDLVIHYTVVNSGNSPARNVVVSEAFRKDGSDSINVSVPFEIAANGDQPLRFGLPIREIRKMSKRNPPRIEGTFADILITYDDVFGDQWSVRGIGVVGVIDPSEGSATVKVEMTLGAGPLVPERWLRSHHEERQRKLQHNETWKADLGGE